MQKKQLCANPHELPVNGYYTAVNGQRYYHGKYANPEEIEDYVKPQCKWCRNISNHEDDCNEPDEIDETDYAAEDEAIALDRMECEVGLKDEMEIIF